MRVLVRRHLEHHALVVEPVGHPVELGARRFHQVDVAAVGGELQRLAHPLVVLDELLHVQRRRGHAVAQRLEDRVTADDQLRGALGAAAPGGRAPVGRLLGLGVGDAVLHMPLARGRGRGRALAFQAPAPLATAADLHTLLVGRAAVPALAIAGHGSPVSSLLSTSRDVEWIRTYGCVSAVCLQEVSPGDGRYGQPAPAGAGTPPVPEPAGTGPTRTDICWHRRLVGRGRPGRIPVGTGARWGGSPQGQCLRAVLRPPIKTG